VCVRTSLPTTTTKTTTDDGDRGHSFQALFALIRKHLFSIVGFHILSDSVKVAKCLLFPETASP
jgi:hypothetical protein